MVTSGVGAAEGEGVEGASAGDAFVVTGTSAALEGALWAAEDEATRP